MMNTNTVQQQLPTNSIDFILTDPPYLANYRSCDGRSIQNDANSDWIRPAMREAYRVLKQDRVAVMFYGWPHGTLVVNLHHDADSLGEPC